MSKAAVKIISVMILIASVMLMGGYVLLRIRYPVKYTAQVENSILSMEKLSKDLTLTAPEKELVLAVVWTESKFNTNAQSKAGAAGLMQLMPQTAEYCAKVLNKPYIKESLYNADYNLELGVFYLSYLLNKFDKYNAIAAYNAGEGNVAKWLNQGLTIDTFPFKETRDYVKRVKNAEKVYKYYLKIY